MSEFVSPELRQKKLQFGLQDQIHIHFFRNPLHVHTDQTTPLGNHRALNMGSSAKKKKEKKKDFQKPKLKVGKTRPKNTNATDTSFSAKSIVFKQQSLSESGRDPAALFNHNLSLLSSKAETQRRDALAYLTAACGTQQTDLPQPVSVVVDKAQQLILDGNAQVRQQLLKLFAALPKDELGDISKLLLYTRAGMTHMSNDIKLSSLSALNWLIAAQPEAVVSCAGGWVKILRTFQNLLGWHEDDSSKETSANATGKWTASKPATNNLGSNKLLVHQLTTFSAFLHAGLTRPDLASQRHAASARAQHLFPLWHTDAHLIPQKSNPYAYLNLFGSARDVEGEMYEDAEERVRVFDEFGFGGCFGKGVKEAKREAGEVGRAAKGVEKALRLVGEG